MNVIHSLTELTAWTNLKTHFASAEELHMRDLFAGDADRAQRMCLDACELFLDYSKHRVTDETMSLLLELAESVELQRHRDAMFSGASINNTEGRAVLHTALRNRSDEDRKH
ncbi:MAG: hypothetical protein VB674_10290 [Vicinamibacterales bacterium]|jgi:glucose-6-phosphate isomerase